MKTTHLPLYWLALVTALIVLTLGCNLGSTENTTSDDDADDDGDDDSGPGVDDDDDGDDDIADDDNDDDNDDATDDDDDDDVYQPPTGLEIDFIDVGQGDAALIRFPGGSTMLIDGGPNELGRLVILPFFDELNLTSLDYMVITHPDADHCGGLDDVVDAIPVGELWENGRSKDTYTWQEFSDAVDQHGIPRHTVERGDTETIDGCDVTVLNADQGFGGADAENANSVVLTIACEGGVVLMTGDATEETQADLIDTFGNDLDADVVKVPHHGSADRDPDFAGHVTPEYAVISVGEDNSYGHPTQEAINDWLGAGADIFRTDEDGDVIVSIDNGSLSVSTEH